MPKVAQYQPNQVLTNVADQPRASAAAGNRLFEANNSIAAGIGSLVEAGVEIKQRIDTASAEEALTKFVRDKNDFFFNPETGYFNTKGKNAVDQAGTITTALDELKSKYENTLTEDARLMFSEVADVHITKGQLDIARHSSSGLRDWEKSNNQDKIENVIENSNLYWNQPDQLRVQLELGRQTVISIAESEGLNADESLQNFESAFFKASITAALNNSGKDASEVFANYGDKLEPQDRIKIKKSIKDKIEVERNQAEASQSVLIGTRLADQYDSREDIRKEVNKIRNTKLRKKTMSEAMYQFNLKKQGESEAIADSVKAVQKHIFKGGSTNSFEAQDPEGWARVPVSYKIELESNKPVVTDKVLFSELMTLDTDKLAEVKPAEYVTQLDDSHYDKLVSAVKVAKGRGSDKDKIDHQLGRSRNEQVNFAVEQLMGVSKTEWTKTQKRQANAFYDLIDNEAKFRKELKKTELTSSEFTDMLRNITKDVTIKGTIFGFGASFLDETSDISGLTPTEVREFSRILRSNNKVVNAESLMKLKRDTE